MDPDVEIGSENIMKLSYLLIPEEGVWLPDLPHIRQCEVFYLIYIAVNTRGLGKCPTCTAKLLFELQTRVIPHLPESHLELVLLHSTTSQI